MTTSSSPASSRPSEPTGSWIPYYEQWPFALQPPDSYAYQLVDEFRGAPTLDKTDLRQVGS